MFHILPRGLVGAIGTISKSHTIPVKAIMCDDNDDQPWEFPTAEVNKAVMKTKRYT